MNDFRNKNPKGRRPPTSIDGLSRPGQKASQFGGGSIGFQKNAAAHTEGSKQLDNFARQDGFQATTPSRPIAAPARDQPIIVPKKPKRSLRDKFRRNRSSIDGMGRRNKLSGGKKTLRVFASFLLVFVLIGGFLFAKGYLNLRKVLNGNGGAAALQKEVDPSRLRGEGDGRVNILVLGRGGEGHEGADLTDTIILASIDPLAKEASLVSIPRDLWMPVAGKGSMRINSVFYTGKTAVLNKSRNKTSEVKKQAEEAGFNLVERTIEKNIGVPIHYHTMIDFSGFKQAVDTIGGVELNAPNEVAERMRIDGRTYTLNVKPGQQHFDGFKALAYARSRHTSPRGDFDRAERQRLIVVALKDKTFTLGTFSNPAKVSRLLDNFGSHVQTNFSIKDTSRLYEITKEIERNKITSLGLADPPNNFIVGKNVGGAAVQVPKAGIGNFREIQKFIRNTLKDSYLRRENASVVVLNGTNVPGVATAKAEELRSFGYNVVSVANAPTKTYTRSIVVDMHSGSKKYTKNYLEKRYNLSVVKSLPDANIQPGSADFVIIIGSDQASR